MIPDKNHTCWRNLVTGRKKIQTSQLGLQMLLQRIQTRVTATSPEPDVRAAVEELHAFFVKYERILATELNSL